MVVYVDLAFAINLFIDASLLFVAAAVYRVPCRTWRVFCASGVGSLYAVATLFPGTALLRLFVVKWLCSVTMVQIALGGPATQLLRYRESVRLLRLVAVFYTVTFAAGGAVYGLQNLFGAHPELAGLAVIHGQIAWWTSIGALAIVASAPVGLWLVKAALVVGRRTRIRAMAVCDAEIRLHGVMVPLRALVDTGNDLVDPVTRTAVAVVHAAAVADLLPGPLARALHGAGDPLRALYGCADKLGDFADRVRIVPFRGVAGGEGQMLAFRPDDVLIRRNGTEFSAMPLLLALQAEVLGRTEHYDCLLPAVVDQTNLVEGRDSGADSGAHATGSSTARSSHSA